MRQIEEISRVGPFGVEMLQALPRKTIIGALSLTQPKISPSTSTSQSKLFAGQVFTQAIARGFAGLESFDRL